MSSEARNVADPQVEIARLRQRLAEAEEVIQAIHCGQADAVVVDGPVGEKVYVLKDADRSYRIFVEEMQQGAATLGRDGLVYYCNRRLAEILQVPVERLRGDLIQSFVAPESVPVFQAMLHQGCAGRCQAEIRLKSGGGIVIAFLTANPLPPDEEADISLIVTDLTEQKEHERLVAHEEQLRVFNHLLEQRVAEATAVARRQAAQLRRLAAELTDAEQRERRRLAQILHDHLQQMLAAARMKLSGIRRRAENPEQREALVWLDDLINQCIEQSRSLTAELSPPVLYDVGLAAALELLGRQMQQKYEMAVQVKSERGVDPIDESVRVLLFQAVRELLFNAYKHSQAKEVCVLAQAEGDEICVTVSDCGVGFDPLSLDGEATASTSFGLFSIRERIKLLGGSLEVDSAPGRGTRITVAAPRRQNTGLADATAQELAPESRRRQPAKAPARGKSRQIRILLADDHKILRQGLAGMLREEEDMEIVAEAADGQEAVELALAMQPDVILMDVTMPRLNGIEATERILAELPEVRIIGLSMHDDPNLVKRMFEAGVVAYVNKSGTSAELTEVIRAHAGKTVG